MIKKEITIYDIAKRLNISPTTVSRGLKNHPAININTKKKITDLAKELGYRSNTFASNLRKQNTNTIGVIIPRLDGFMSNVMSGIERIVNNAGYNLIITQSFESLEKEKTNAATMFNSRVDGLIVSLSNDFNGLNHFRNFIKKGVPLIFFDRIAEDFPSTKVVIDNFKGGYIATTHLIEQGCKNILHITGTLNGKVYRDRFEGYKKALADQEIAYSPEMFISNALSETEIIDCFKNDILKRRILPDGIFITNDFSAAFAIKVLKEAGIKVPEDIAIIGFNNDQVSKVTEPPISTINYPSKEMGESIARILVSHFQGNGDLSITNTVLLNTELVIRGSSLKKKTTRNLDNF